MKDVFYWLCGALVSMALYAIVGAVFIAVMLGLGYGLVFFLELPPEPFRNVIIIGGLCLIIGKVILWST